MGGGGWSRQKIYKIKGSPKNAQKSGKSRNKKPAPYRFIHFLGEGGGVTSEMTAPWTETTLQTILQNYDKDDIYNADKFGLFYQALQKKTLHFKNEKCTGGKHSKIRLTGMAAANMAGEKLPMFVIGKAAKPRCFKNIKQLPCRYRSQKNSWMNAELFEDWVRYLDRKFEADGRKISLILDNCPSHPDIGGLASI